MPVAAVVIPGPACADEADWRRLSDAPDAAPDAATRRPLPAADAPSSHAEALRRWTSAEAMAGWLGAHFEYDATRALALSETARQARPADATHTIHTPEAFFARPRGICVDLAHFAVATLRQIEPQAQAAYLMIEFEPVQIAGQLLRRHWLAAFQRDGRHFFVADSKRPGHLAGPCASVEQFLADYAAYRGRPIVAHRLLASHQRQLRRQAPRALRTDAAPDPAL
ncbi:MAG: hypothetical protein KBC73_03575 [Burkholderiaceae bacterium]|nr:hypothetical protein [Burkholderiaceae bacterium]